MSVNATTVERLGRYEVLGEIASGGMATVFLGRVTGAKGFQRLVAIKRLHPHLESEEDFVSMFLDEARLAAKIRHQNVVGTLDVEDQEGLYIVMEYIEGDRLLGLLRHAAKSGERIPIPVAIRIALDTLAGLHAAHELPDDDGEMLGLVHRDVSPQNVLVGVDGVARLTDFGIAKATSRLTVTRDGQLKGKIAYMAPEQTKRVEIDRRVDIFAMGIITWEMLTSKKLFTGESDVEVLNQLLFEPIPRLKESAPGIPPAIDAAVMKALERDPAKRYSTAAEFADSLERASKVLGGPANARTVAAHLQKVSAEKIAKDRARISSAGTPGVPGEGQSIASRVRRATGNFPAANTGQHQAIVMPDEPSRPGNAASPPVLPTRAAKATMVGIPAPQMPMTTGPAVKATPSTPPSPPVVAADQTLIDDDEDVPTSAVVRTKEMAEALGVANRAMPSTKTPGASNANATGANAAIPAVPTAAPSSLHSPAVGPPPVPLTRPVSVPPTTNTGANATPVSTSLPVESEAPSSGRRNVFIALTLALVAGGVGTAVVLARNTNGTSAPHQATQTTTPTPASPSTATTAPAVPTPPANPGGETPNANGATPAPPVANGATAGTPTTPDTTNANSANAPNAPAAVPGTPAANVAANPPAANTAANAPAANVGTPPEQTQPTQTAAAGTATPRTGHGSHAASTTHTATHTGTTTTSGTGTTTTAAPHNTGHATTGHGGHDDDPFGTDNPYQR